METSNSFGYWLRRRRKALDLTQEALARLAGCTTDTIKKIEADLRRPSRQLAERLADCLAIPLGERTVFLQAARAELSVDRMGLADQPVAPPVTPAGTTTFLLTDIQASTTLWDRQPAAMAAALVRHDLILQQAITRHGGHPFKKVGDGIYAAFARVGGALAAALDAQRSLRDENWGAIGKLRVRMALHTGEALVRDGDYLGPPMNRAARLLAAAHGGQILLSRATVELVRDALPPGVSLRDLGERRLRGLSRSEQIFQVVADDLPAAFPPLRTPDVRANNLPAQPNLFIGRERELAVLRDLLRRPGVRLVTLTGPGGIGKTRLALSIADELLDDFAHGIWFVDLAPITDPELIVPRIAQILGVTESGSQPLVESLHAHVRHRQLLILLDNLEQVLAAAPQIAQLLAAAPGLKVLTTSRVVLHLSGEYEFTVPSLSLPEQQTVTEAGQLTHYEAARLFVERAQAASAFFTVTNENAPAVAEICQRLDGLPLAVELAAARIKTFSPGALLDQLSRRLAVLTGGPRDLPARQQNLRDTIEWSYQLLDSAEQLLFVRLAVFVGGCTPAAAAAVTGWGAAAGDSTGHADINEALLALAHKNLLRYEGGLNETLHFTMLETIREYALERLAATGELVAVQQRHEQYYVTLAEEAAQWLPTSQRSQWLDQLDTEYGNLREVLVRSAAADGDETLLRLSAALWWYWYFRGYANEGRAWLQEALVRSDSAQPNPTLQWVHCGAGVLAWVQGDQVVGGKQLETSVAGWRELADERALAYALTFRGLVLQYHFDLAAARTVQDESVALFRRGQDRWGLSLALAARADLCYFVNELRQARALYEESIRLARELMDGWNLPWALSGLGFVAYAEGEGEQAEQLFTESIPLLRAGGSKLRLASTLNKLGNVLRARGQIEEAVDCYETSLTLFRDLDTQLVVAGPLHNLAFIALEAGDDRRAVALFAESIAVARQQQDWGEVATGLGGLGAVAAVRGELPQSARIFASMERLLVGCNEELDQVNRDVCDRYCFDVRRSLGAAHFALAWAEGEAMPAEQLIDEVLRNLV